MNLPNLAGPTTNPLSPFSGAGSSTSGSTTPFIIAGLKPTQPGSIAAPTSSNTLKPSQVSSTQVAAPAKPVSSPNMTGPISPSGVPQYTYVNGKLATVNGQAINNPLATPPTPAQTAANNTGLQQSPFGVTPQQAASAVIPNPGTPQSSFPVNPSNPVPGTLGTGTPQQIAANMAPTGLIGNEVAQGVQNLQTQQAQINPAMAQEEQQLADINNTAQLTAAGNIWGTGQDYQSRLGNLNLQRQAVLQSIASQQGQLNDALQLSQNPYQTGLNALTNLQQAPYGTPLVNPATGQVTDTAGTGASGIVGNWASYLAGGGDPNQVPASVSGNSVLWNQVLSQAQQQNPNFNVNISLGQAAGRQAVGAAGGSAAAQNIQTGGTATNTAYNQVYQSATNSIAQYSTAKSSINNLGSSILQMMSNTPGINPSDSRFLNTKINDLQTQFNSPAYAQFNAQIAGLQRMVSQYLNQGEIPSAATAGASALVDGSVTVGALASTLQGIGQDLDSAISASQQTAAYAQSQLGNQNSNANTNSPSPWH